MKRVLVMGVTAVAAVALGACSAPSQNSSTPSSKTTKVIKATHGAAKSSKAEKPSSSTSDGPLTNVGESRDQSDIGRITLLKIYHPASVVSDAKITLKIDSLKVFKVETQTKSQRDYWHDDWNTELPNPYYYAQVTWAIGNQTGADVTLEGFQSVVFNGRAYSRQQVYDDTQGLAVPNNSTTRDTLLAFPIDESAIESTKLGVALAEINDSAQEKVVIPAMNTATIELTK